jgi:hypothetical protein
VEVLQVVNEKVFQGVEMCHGFLVG